MKTVRTKQLAKARVKNSQQETLAKSFEMHRERINSFTHQDRREERRFETSLQGFRYVEEKHEASLYLSEAVARVTLSSRGRVAIPREMRARLGIKPGQIVSITTVDGVVHIVPVPQPRKSDRATLQESVVLGNKS